MRADGLEPVMWNTLIRESYLYENASAALDHEHQHFNDLIGELHLLLANDASDSEQLSALRDVDAFVRINCQAEEAVMDDCSFPLATVHKEEHRSHYDLVRHIELNIKAFKTGEALSDLMDLHQVLLTHLRNQDQDVVDWTRRQERDLRY